MGSGSGNNGMKQFKIETGPIGLEDDTKPDAVIQASIAISLKRIADALEADKDFKNKPLFEQVFGNGAKA